MPADQLSPNTTATAHTPRAAATPEETADGVLAVLAGAPLHQVAADLGMPAADLDEAIQTYQQAGHAALEAQAAQRDWYQVHLQFPEWAAAEETAVTNIGPQLQRLQDAGVVAAWWFIRKAPCWRLRLMSGHTTTSTEMKNSVNAIMDGLTAASLISRWRQRLYEPEAAAFGGRTGMDIAHHLACSDSSNILAYLRQPEPIIGRRELSVLLCTTLFRAAGQEWFECGDVWHRVTRLRPIPVNTPADRLAKLTDSVRKLLTSDTSPSGALFGTDGPLSFAACWAAAFHHAGQALAAAANEGTLERGTRDILAHHVIFHWNRIGLPTRTQSILARAARDTVMNPPGFAHPQLAAQGWDSGDGDRNGQAGRRGGS